MTLSIIPLFLGPTELILILLVVLLLFGGRKIPELMRGLGRGVKEFKDSSKEDGKDGSKDGGAKKRNNLQQAPGAPEGRGPEGRRSANGSGTANEKAEPERRER